MRRAGGCGRVQLRMVGRRELFARFQLDPLDGLVGFGNEAVDFAAEDEAVGAEGGGDDGAVLGMV